jgi:hypothetical protein
MIILWMDRVVRKLGFVSSFQKSFIYLICNSLLLIGRKMERPISYTGTFGIVLSGPCKKWQIDKKKN